jgi:dihydroorotate dehydrogenase/Pyruvate/2-oxoacid:ferredoxin oxidoreductase delta subunit
MDISVRIDSLRLRNPFIVGSGPSARTVEQLKAAEDAGWAAASLKLTMDPQPYISLPPRYRWIKESRLHLFTAEKRLTADEGLRLMEKARAATRDLLLFANISYEAGDEEGWAGLASRFEQAGAHAIELNMCCPNMSFNESATGGGGEGKAGGTEERRTGASLGADLATLRRVVPAVRSAVTIPVIVKLTPEGGRVAEAARACMDAGASAVGSTANRLGVPEVDIQDPKGSFYRLQEGLSLGCLSGPWVRPLGLRDTYEIRRLLGPQPTVIGSGGVSDLPSAVRQIMVGADALWVCTETMLRGFAWLPRLLDDLRGYMDGNGWTRLSDFRDLLLPEMRPAGSLVTHEGHAVLDGEACTACGTCWKIGHCHAISHADGRTVIDADACLGCSTCVDLCPRRAISMARR